MANLKLRFTVFSDQQEEGLKLPNDQLQMVKDDVMKSLESVNRELSVVDFVFTYKGISSVSNVCSEFIENWTTFKSEVKELTFSRFKSYLLFEFDLTPDNAYPGLVFSKEFVSFLGELRVELQSYFYSAD